MKNYKLSMTTDILAPRINHLTSENRALKNKIKELESTRCITIEVEGGCVIDVSGIPDNYTYIIKDND